MFGYASPELDEKIALGKRTIDQAERVPIYQEMNEIFLEKPALVPLFLENSWFIVSNRLHIPVFAKLPLATSVDTVPVAPSFMAWEDIWSYRSEQWDIRE